MIIGKFDYLPAGLFRNAFTRRRKSFCYEWDKMLCVYLVQKEYVSKLIEGHRRIGEDLHHHMAFASIKAITYLFVSLPVRPESSLKEQWILKLRNVLKFINADNYLHTLRFGNAFREVKNLIRIALHLLPIKVNGNFISRTCSH